MVLEVEESAFDGLSCVVINGLMLSSNTNERLISVKSVSFVPNWFSLLSGHLVYSELKANGVSVYANSPTKIDAIRKLSLKQDKLSTKDTENVGYNKKIRSLFNALLRFADAKLNIRDLAIQFNNNKLIFTLSVDSLISNGNEFDFLLTIQENSLEGKWHTTMSVDQKTRTINGSVENMASIRYFPFLRYCFNGDVSAHKAFFSISDNQSTIDSVLVNFKLDIDSLKVDQRRIASKPLEFAPIHLNFYVGVGNNSLRIDSLSTITLDSLMLSISAGYLKEKYRLLDLGIKIPSTEANKYVKAVPKGFFTVLDGLKFNGDLGYSFNLQLNIDSPEQVSIEANAFPKKLRITKMGNENLGKMSGEFFHTPYENGKPMKTFAVGPSNPNFVPLDKISPLLQQAVLSSEDGSFFTHGGFNLETFQSSIAVNIRAKRFLRGASTISMQLVKNIFLSREKTLSRKLEEIAIVWLIENQRLTSKERMFEVYLNIIEWGPGVYGIGPASKFYFNKTAGYLTINEAIFLASIVPAPKYFRYRFEKNGQLKNNLQPYFKTLSRHMVARGIITQEIRDEMLFGLQLTGPAKLLLNKPLEPLPDSIDINVPNVN